MMMKRCTFRHVFFVLMVVLLVPAAVSAQLLDDSALQKINAKLAALNLNDLTVDLNVRIAVAGTPNQPAVDLFATVIRHGNAPKPTILVATPYRREIMMMLYLPLLTHDYQLMAIDIRGTGSSEGQWVSFGPEEHLDIAYVIDEWIPTQPWSDGKIGMIGPSYMAIIQMLVSGQIDQTADGTPIHLKALFPFVSMSDAYRDIVMHGGNVDLEFIPMWLGMVDILGLLPPMLSLGEQTPFQPSLDDLAESAAIWEDHLQGAAVSLGWIMDYNNAAKTDFYESKSPMIYWPQKPAGGWNLANYSYLPAGTIPSKLPVFLTGGWFDIFTRGTLNNYQYGLKNHSVGNKALLVGPWYHLDGSLGLGVNGLITGDITARWFDWKIKGVNDPFMVNFPTVLYIEGEKRWRAEKSWPLPASRVTNKSYYLSKKKISQIWADWFDDLNLINNFKLVDAASTSDYYDQILWWKVAKANPSLTHDPMLLHGLISRSSTRWLMGLTALVSQASRLMFNADIDALMPFEDERLDEVGVLTFTTDELTQDIEISGPLTLTFWAKTDFRDNLYAWQVDQVINGIKDQFNIDSNLLLDLMNKNDVQWVVELNDVFPNGRARNITSGWLSAWHRPYNPSSPAAIDPVYLADPFNPFYCNADKNPLPIQENTTYAYVVEYWPCDNVFKAGHRIRVSISASDFPHLLPVLRPSKNTIVIDDTHKARLDFKVVNKTNEGVTWKWIDNVDTYLKTHTN